jgi:uncharacterized coiled-coil protein SlyX
MSVEERVARLEERVAKLEQAVVDLKQYVELQLNHFNFYQRLILILLGVVLFMIGGKELLSLLIK